MSADLGLRQRATATDLARVYALLEEGSAWLRSKGLAQWNPPYPIERFRRELEAGYVWLWAERESPIATVTLFPTRPDYYPDQIWSDGIPAWYICRLAVARRLAGGGVGHEVLTQIERDAAANGLAALRLDVTASNPFLERYYVERGYTRVATGDIKGGASVFLEKRLV